MPITFQNQEYSLWRVPFCITDDQQDPSVKLFIKCCLNAFQEGVNNSRISKLLRPKITLIIIAIIIAATIWAMIFFFGDENNKSKNTKYLPPNCYLLNDKIICPNNKNSVQIG